MSTLTVVTVLLAFINVFYLCKLLKLCDEASEVRHTMEESLGRFVTVWKTMHEFNQRIHAKTLEFHKDLGNIQEDKRCSYDVDTMRRRVNTAVNTYMTETTVITNEANKFLEEWIAEREASERDDAAVTEDTRE